MAALYLFYLTTLELPLCPDVKRDKLDLGTQSGQVTRARAHHRPREVSGYFLVHHNP
jgi:hypothetical protein